MSNLTAVYVDENGRTVLTARGSAHHRRHMRQQRDVPPPKRRRRKEVAADEREADAVQGAASSGDEAGVAGG
ncbi:hypothetical protein ACEE18_05830 [Corynebacterium freneyi]